MVKFMGDIMSLHVQNKMSVDFENSAVAKRKGQLSIQKEKKKKGNAKEYSNYLTIALISYVSKIMFKVPQARLQQ